MAALEGEKPVKDKRKRNPTGYNVFVKEMRQTAVEEMWEGENRSPKEVITHLRAMWNALDDEEREEWNEKANPTGYNVFVKEMRQTAVEEMWEGENRSPKEVMTHLRAMWNALDDEEREEWNWHGELAKAKVMED